MNQTYYEFREAESVEELRELFRFRHRIYKESRLKDFCSDTPDEMDLNFYDLCSLHFGFFHIDENGNQSVVGYHRIVQDTDGPMKSEVLMIASEYPEVLETITRIPDAPLPVMTYYPEPEVLCSFYAEVKAKGKVIKEATKFGVDTAVRHHLAIARHIIEFEFAVHFLVHEVDYGIMACTLLHSRFYRKYGYHPLEGGKIFGRAGYEGIVIVASQESVRTILTDRVRKMAEVYRETGRICYNPKNPDNYYASLGSYVKSRPVFTAVAE